MEIGTIWDGSPIEFPTQWFDGKRVKKMGVNDIYGGNYVNAATVKSGKISGKPLTISRTRTETFGENMKIVVSFSEMEKELPLNKTNATTLGEAFGDDYLTWPGKKLMLVLTKVNYQGNMVDGIQVVPQ